MSKRKNINEWITTRQAAEMLGVTPRQVKYLIPRFFPSATKLNGATQTYLLLLSEVQAEIERRAAKKRGD